MYDITKVKANKVKTWGEGETPLLFIINLLHVSTHLFLHQGASSSTMRNVLRFNNASTVKPAKLATLISRPRVTAENLWLIAITRHDTTKQNVLLWFWYARIHSSLSPTANDKGSVVRIGKRENYFCACRCMSLLDSVNARSVHDTIRHDTTVQSW